MSGIEEERQEEPVLQPEEPHSSPTRPEEQVAECEESIEDHAALCEATGRALRDLLEADKYLSDIPYDISPEEVEDEIAVLKGQSITVHVKRDSLPTFHVIVPQTTATVFDLKKAIRRTFDLDSKRQRNREIALSTRRSRHRRRHTTNAVANISWRYIWRTYLLENVDAGVYDGDDDSGAAGIGGGQFLIDDQQLLSSYGVVNKSIVRFVKRSKVERRHKKQRRGKGGAF